MRIPADFSEMEKMVSLFVEVETRLGLPDIQSTALFLFDFALPGLIWLQ
jgi:hypothetical protein